MPPLPTTDWPRILLLWLCGVAAAMQFAKIAFLFQALQAHYAVGAAQAGLLLSTVGMVGLVLGVTAGLYAPAIGYRRLLLGGMGLGVVVSLVQSLLPPFGLFWATRVLEGASHLAVVVAAPTLMLAYCAPRHRSIAMGLWSTFFGVAFALTAAGGGWVVARFGVAGVLGGHAAALALVGIATLLWVRTDAPDTAPWPPLSTLPRRHLDIYRHGATALPGACFFFYTLGGVALLTFLPLFAKADRAWVAVLLPLVSIAGTFTAGWLAQTLLPPARLVRWAFTGVACAGLLLGASLFTGLGFAPAALLLVATVGLAGGASFALIPQLNDAPHNQARANGAVAQLGNLGATLGPPLFASLIALGGGAGLVLLVLVCGVAGLSLASWGLRQRS
jgi:AAHS family 3-hydroxyphenylpropionic acid transporter